MALIEIEFISPVLVLASVTAETALREPTVWGEKLRDVGDRVMPGLSILSGICMECTQPFAEVPVMVTEYMPPGVRNWLAMVIVELAPADPG